MNVEDLLLNAFTGATNEVRNRALNGISAWLSQNPDDFVSALAGILVGTGKDAAIQQLACTQLKQVFTVQSSPDQDAAANRWWSMSEQTRIKVKNALFNSLQIPVVNKVAAVAIAPIALIELSRGQWLDLIQAFSKVGMSVEFPPSTVVATLACIGFLVEQASLSAKGILNKDTVNALLTVLVFRMGPTPNIDPNSPDGIDIRSQATLGMYHLIDYTTSNFANASERFVIMKSVLANSTVQTDPLIKKYALRSLERVVRKQYNYLSCKIPTDLVNPANGESEIIELIFTVTFNQVDFVIQKIVSTDTYLYGGEPEGDCAIDAVNVWRSLASYEYELKCTQSAANQTGYSCANYIQRALGTLVPKLLMGMCTQVENQDIDIINVSAISGVALRECAKTTGGLIVPHIMSFVNANVANENWRFADTSCLAFGIVVEYGNNSVDSYVADATKFFIEKSLKHSVLVVRESAAWVLGMICKYKFFNLFQSNLVNSVINAFSMCFSDDIRVVANICTAIYNMAHAAAENGPRCGFSGDEHALSGITKDIITALLKALQRPDANDQHFLSSVYECINSLVMNAPDSLLNVVEGLLVEIAKGITGVVGQIIEITSRGGSMQNNILETNLAHMCGTLNTIVSRISQSSKELLMKYNLSIAELLIKKIIFSNAVSSNVTVVEEAILALDALVLGVEGDCFPYAVESLKIAIEVLKHPEHADTFGVGVGLAGDVVASVGDKTFESRDINLYANVVQCTDTVIELIQIAVDRICNSNGKMAHFTMNALINALPQFVAVNSEQFLSKYLGPIMRCLSRLTTYCMMHNSDEDTVLLGEDYLETDIINGEFETNHSKIQYSILTAWGCVISCVIDDNSGNHAELLNQMLHGILEFIGACYNNGKCTRRIMLNAITLASDVAYFQPEAARVYLSQQSWFRTMINTAQHVYSEPKDTQSLATSMQVFRHAGII